MAFTSSGMTHPSLADRCLTITRSNWFVSLTIIKITDPEGAPDTAMWSADDVTLTLPRDIGDPS